MDATALPLGNVTRFGVLGGSFNPVHVGHISVAQQILNALKLEKVFLLPAQQNPHKADETELAPPHDRLEMCRLAVRSMKGLEASDMELQRPGPSFTIETARALRAAYGPAAKIYFLIGSDSLADLPKWKEIRELLSLADFAIADRRQAPLEEKVWNEIRAQLGEHHEQTLRAGVVKLERVDVSATGIRRLLRAGEKIPGLLRRDVDAYIRKRGLYAEAQR